MSKSERSLRVAIVGAGPAGIYAANALIETSTPVSVDLFERLPAPFGLIRYGVAPDHPRIKGIVSALHKVLDKPQVRLLGNVEYGRDIDLAFLRKFYDAVIFSTGADSDRELEIPGVALAGSHGAADFVAWYDGHPDVPREWSLDAEQVAVLGVGNVALDVARVLAKPADELRTTEIPANVMQCLASSRVRDVHVFGRRGPAQAKFSPLELRELDHSESIRVVVDPEDLVLDAASEQACRESKQVEMVVSTLRAWSDRGPSPEPRRIHLHFLQSPVAVLGADGHVTGLRTEQMRLDGTGGVRGTGVFRHWPIQAVYRAVGYRSRSLQDLPFDERRAVVPNEGGRVHTLDGQRVEAAYVTGWIKRGPVGLIGHTKGDANETVANLLADAAHESGRSIDFSKQAPLDDLARRGVRPTTWEGWYRLDALERTRGSAEGRERVKVVDRDVMIEVSTTEVGH